MADELLNNMLDMDEEDRKIVLEDEETGEAIEFILDDAFKFGGKDYESVIMESVEEDGEMLLQTIPDKEADVIYDYYDKLCDELYGDEESDE